MRVRAHIHGITSDQHLANHASEMAHFHLSGELTSENLITDKRTATQLVSVSFHGHSPIAGCNSKDDIHVQVQGTGGSFPAKVVHSTSCGAYCKTHSSPEKLTGFTRAQDSQAGIPCITHSFKQHW